MKSGIILMGLLSAMLLVTATDATTSATLIPTSDITYTSEE
ncbi:MAG: hypothetical protein V4620_08425 [Bacteroidota bacterium]